MQRNPLKHSLTLTALVASALGFGVALPSRLAAQEPAVPYVPVAPATLNRLFSDAEKAFSNKEYDAAVAKIQELLKALPPNPSKDLPIELLYFNIGLGQLLGGHPAEAEAAFTECLRRYPQGEYATRCYLGIGRACMDQGTDDKKQRAIEALKRAAADPKYRSEAGLWLGQVYNELHQPEEAMTVFKSLMGSDIRSAQQTTAAVEVIGLLADSGKLEDLIVYLDRLSNQAGIRDAIAWYANQLVAKGDELVGTGTSQGYESALALYRSVPLRNQIISIQNMSLETQRRDVKTLEARVAAEQNKPLNQRSTASEFLNNMKPALDLAEKAVAAIQEKADLDPTVLMRRGRCLYYLDRNEEALVCFRAIRNKYPKATDAQAAAYAEIVLLNKLKQVDSIKTLGEKYMRDYPAAENVEQVSTLVGEVIVQSGDWAAVRKFYADLSSKFPKSENIDRFTFFQGLAFFQDGDFKQSTPIFTKFLQDFPNSLFTENAMYYVAMSNFLSNEYKKTLAACKAYLSKFPDGRYAGDIRYRLAFIDFNDKEEDQNVMSDKIIRDLTAFVTQHPDDAASGSMLCLIGDTWKRKKSDKQDEVARFERNALEAYKKAVWSNNPDDVIQYALDSATTLMQSNKDWAGIAALHSKFLQDKPDSALALLSATWVAKMKVREGKGPEAAEMLALALKTRIGIPSSEQVEFLLDELVKTLVPRKKAKDINVDEIDKQLVDILNKAVGDQANRTTDARIYYARARLAQLLRRSDRSDLYMKGIATINAKDPSVLSPALLASSGDILLKMGDLDAAEAMYKRLVDRYKDGMFADAGPVGLGYVALQKKKPDEALKIFTNALEVNPGQARFKEATLGKIEATADLGNLDEAEKLALQTVGDRMFRGESSGKAYLLLAHIYRMKAAKAASNDDKLELLKKAHAIYQRVYLTFQSTPDVCSEGYWQAYKLLDEELGNKTLAKETLKTFLENEKMKNTERYKEASKLPR